MKEEKDMMNELLEKARAGAELSREEALKLLNIPVGSMEYYT